ncbi:hypothetical protein FRB91_008505 [Serendipita sp. 411]|nr:hypothetical protein FRC19_008182 [Serendipita sp. 401]KAG8836731.1 hypothetical protein FRB91_008505 [Serendipita sp. 411]
MRIFTVGFLELFTVEPNNFILLSYRSCGTGIQVGSFNARREYPNDLDPPEPNFKSPSRLLRKNDIRGLFSRSQVLSLLPGNSHRTTPIGQRSVVISPGTVKLSKVQKAGSASARQAFTIKTTQTSTSRFIPTRRHSLS